MESSKRWNRTIPIMNLMTTSHAASILLPLLGRRRQVQEKRGQNLGDCVSFVGLYVYRGPKDLRVAKVPFVWTLRRFFVGLVWACLVLLL